VEGAALNIWTTSNDLSSPQFTFDLSQNLSSYSCAEVTFTWLNTYGALDQLKDIEADGKITFVITKAKTTPISQVNLFVDDSPVSAPDGGTTIVLLGASLLGVGMIRRKNQGNA
jgi:hypothetical protein